MEGLLSSYDAWRILRFPISMHRPCDRQIWHFSKDGNYNVKLSYRDPVNSMTNILDGPLSGLW